MLLKNRKFRLKKNCAPNNSNFFCFSFFSYVSENNVAYGRVFASFEPISTLVTVSKKSYCAAILKLLIKN